MGLAALLAAATLLAAEPEYTNDGELRLPADYREWIFLSSGHGMTYGPNTPDRTAPLFDNVFVNPEAYRAFLETGRWPDKAMFVLEIRRAATEGSINKGGEFQQQVLFREIEVKDEARFDGGWGFFEFSADEDTAALSPYDRDCYTCHRQNTAVENTFVQFYPTLMEVARAKGTVKQSYLDSENPDANE